MLVYWRYILLLTELCSSKCLPNKPPQTRTIPTYSRDNPKGYHRQWWSKCFVFFLGTFSKTEEQCSPTVQSNPDTAELCRPKFLAAYRKWRKIEILYNRDFYTAFLEVNWGWRYIGFGCNSNDVATTSASIPAHFAITFRPFVWAASSNKH